MAQRCRSEPFTAEKSLGRRSRVANGLFLIGCCLLCLTCGSSLSPASGTSADVKSMAPWVFAGTDGSAVSAADMRGRATVVLFLTTYDTASQIAAARFEHCIHSLSRRTNAIAVAMEPPDHAVLVSTFHDSLKLSYPILMPDPSTLVGQGPFGVIGVVPTWVVLDAYGQEVWRGVGVRALPELGDAVSRLADGGDSRSHGCT
jgi:hypothetical protein